MAPRFETFAEARAAFLADRPRFEEMGVILHPTVLAYVSEDVRRDPTIAMDAQVDLTTVPNAGVPALLTTNIDPEVYEVLFSPNKGAEILGERKKGNWLSNTELFPMVEVAGEVASYGDFENSGMSNANTNWVPRQSYLFQTVINYGERELAMAGLGGVNWVSTLQKSAANSLNKFQNLSYFYGIGGLINYGLLNDPDLTPATKAATPGSGKWITNGRITATANEIYDDIVNLYSQLVSQTQGLVDAETKITLALSPASEVALSATNNFNVNVRDLLKKNYPNIRVVTAVQYGAYSTANPQGNLGGELVQMIADSAGGQDTGYAAFNEKMRAHAIIQDLSSWKQKNTSGTWGAIIRQPMDVSQMVGV